MKIKAITISQPWADKIRRGDKFVENRCWACSYRGPIAIHAGKGAQYLSRDELAKYTTGAVVAIAELVACMELRRLQKICHVSPDMEIEGTRFTVGDIVNHKYAEGAFCWVLDNIRAIEPIVVPGKQGLWLWDCQQEIKYLDQVPALSWKDIEQLNACLKDGFVWAVINRNGHMDHAQWQSWQRLVKLGFGRIAGDLDGADSFEINDAGRAAVTHNRAE